MTMGNVDDPRSRVTVEREEWYEIRVGDKPILYYNKVDSDSVLTLLGEQRLPVVDRTTAEGRWTNRFGFLPSCFGRITVGLDSLEQPVCDVRKLVEKNITQTEKTISDLDVIAEEMEYFFSVHSVQDAGYELVTAYYEQTLRETERQEQVLLRLRRCLTADSLTVVHNALYKAKYKNKQDSTLIDTCFFDGRYVRTMSRKTPRGRCTVPSQAVDTCKIVPVTHHPSPANHYPIVQSNTSPRGGREGASEEVFALRVTPDKGVQLGEWKDGRFKGERLEYSDERIYGIDISRYQHEKGRKRFSINWKNLRITSLGTLSKKTVKGVVDYPVSFCYIKATEGINIQNRYYASDYKQARRYGIHVGTYHFFSTKSSGAQQARWFLRHLKMGKGDFPPVLDLEPTEAAIRRMGGVDKLFREVRVWLNAVEARTGKRPILYVSQSFVNKHLSQAADLKRNYQVWIARYGEYKPDVHMLFWQLSPDGRVRGITPKVDINVFNGYSDKFQQFVEKQ